MPFVKLDTGILNSTLWVEPMQRHVFITALLMAVPHEVREPMEQLAATENGIAPTGFVVPPGWYGFVQAAGPGIVRTAMVDYGPGMDALRLLGSPDTESRSGEFDGRRLVRVDGGFLVLNFMRYRDKDMTAKDRVARYRQRQKESNVTRNAANVTRNEVTVTRNKSRGVTIAEAEAEAEKRKEKDTPPATPATGVREPTFGAKELSIDGVDSTSARDWLKARRAKKLPLTESAWNLVKLEAGKAGMTPAQAVKHAAEVGWAGFKASWLTAGATPDAYSGTTL